MWKKQVTNPPVPTPGVPSAPEEELLRRFLPFTEMDTNGLNLVYASLRQQQAAAGTPLFERGSQDPYSYFLLSGCVELEPQDGKRLRIEGGTNGALTPLSELRPRRYRARAVTAIRYFTLDTAMLNTLHRNSDDGLSVLLEAEAPITESDPARQLLSKRIRADLARDRLILPSLPDIALRVGEALRDPRIDNARLAAVIQLDPAITAKLIRVANSALYGGGTSIKSCQDALARLGMNATNSLVISFALREVFRAQSRFIQKRMERLWRHSIRVAAISYVLAGITQKFDAERVLLAGLVHDIGLVPLLVYADAIPGLSEQTQVLESILSTLRAEIGTRVLSAWGFAPDLLEVVSQAENWLRDSGDPQPDYADLVIVAQLHGYIGSPDCPANFPNLEQVPALHKLFPDTLSPKDSLKLLRRANDKIMQIEAPLRGA